VAMDEEHLAAAARYVALNPVRARLVELPCQFKKSPICFSVLVRVFFGVTLFRDFVNWHGNSIS